MLLWVFHLSRRQDNQFEIYPRKTLTYHIRTNRELCLRSPASVFKSIQGGQDMEMRESCRALRQRSILTVTLLAARFRDDGVKVSVHRRGRRSVAIWYPRV